MEFDVVVDSYVKKVKCDYGILHVWILNFDLDTHIRNLLNENKKTDCINDHKSNAITVKTEEAPTAQHSPKLP